MTSPTMCSLASLVISFINSLAVVASESVGACLLGEASNYATLRRFGFCFHSFSATAIVK